MKQLCDGTHVRAIMWYLALEYKDYLLQNGELPPPLNEMDISQFIKFCDKAIAHFMGELKNKEVK